MSLNHIFVAVQALSCLFIVGYTLFSLNRMSRGTRHTMRTADVVILVSGFAGFLSCFEKHDFLYAVFALGVAIRLASEKRKQNADPGPAA